ncbi:MAG: hypothetical protein JNK63_10245 [Chthonomonas sp.]|nr:hypothetical protein [Chthonomonas sp.]
MTWNEVMVEAARGSADPAVLLRHAGRLGLRRRAAAKHTKGAEVLKHAPSSPAPNSEAIAPLIRLMIRDFPATLDELFAELGRRSLPLPYGSLPEMLTIVGKSPAQILPLLGEKGMWLASQNSDWMQNLSRAQKKADPLADNLSVGAREEELLKRLKLPTSYEEGQLPRLLSEHFDWSVEFSRWVLGEVSFQFHRAGPPAQFWRASAAKVAASIHPGTLDEAEIILHESQAAASHPIIKAWFPILAVRRRLHRFLDSLDT